MQSKEIVKASLDIERALFVNALDFVHNVTTIVLRIAYRELNGHFIREKILLLGLLEKLRVFGHLIPLVFLVEVDWVFT